MIIPYRTQRAIRRAFLALVVLAVVIAAGCACWFIWAQRYIVYTADGQALLDFDLPPLTGGNPATAPDKTEVNIFYDAPKEEEKEEIPVSTELAQMTGYYVSLAELQDLPTLKAQIQALPAGTPVMLDVRNSYDGFYYSSQVRPSRSKDVDIAQMDAFIAWLNTQDIYTIAKLPALRFSLQNLRDFAVSGSDYVPDSVHHISGIGSYPDNGYYWLHPGRAGTVAYLSQVIVELRTMGFDEVVLEDFCFPQNTEDILVEGDRAEILTKTARSLLTTCSTDQFAVSFVKTEDFTPPTGRSRIYLTGLDAVQAANAAQNSGVENPAIQLVFLTELYDTRFDVYSVLRPISGAY